MKKKNLLLLSGVFLIITLFTVNAYSREVISINEEWNFSNSVETPRGLGWGASRAGSTVVNLPHTWNSVDFLSDGGYRRGYGSYRKEMEIPIEYKGKRLFLKFEGAGTVATVFVNSSFVGEHKGAYNAFTYEITDLVNYGARNTINVICDNSLKFDVAPRVEILTCMEAFIVTYGLL